MRRAGAIAIFACVSIGAFTIATQTLAALFRYQPALGAPLLHAGGGAVYAPWAVLSWSSKWRDHYPRPFAMADFILVCGVGLGVLVAAVASSGGAPRLRRHGPEAWATLRDASAAGLLANAGAILGKLNGELLAFDGAGHLLLIGASRSGKGRGHVVPTLLAWPHSALVLDIKGELASGDARHGFAGTAGFRESLGPTLRFAPTQKHSAHFNPLFEVRKGANEVRDVQNVVEIIVDPAGDRRHDDFWDRSAKQVLVGVILHVLYCEPDHRKTLAVVRERLRDLDACAEHMRLVLHRRSPETGAPETHPEVQHAAESYLAGEERMRSGIKATAESFFGIFADPLIAANTSASDFRVGDLMCAEKPVTLFLQPPPSDATRLMPLMRLVLNQITRSLMEEQTADAGGRKKRHQLLLLLDEFPQLGRLSFFETAMGAFAGYGLKAYLVCQSLNHITRAYGRDNVIIDNCQVVTAFAAADVETAKTIAAMTGERWEMVEQESVSRPRTLLTRRGATSFREERRPLMLPSDIRELPLDQQIIFATGAKPLRAQKLRFDEEPVFAGRVRAATWSTRQLTVTHDWAGVRALGRLVKDKKGGVKVAAALAARESAGQRDLFPDLKISEQALAGLRAKSSSQSSGI
ncbi:MAG: type IV secretory system conjugative DNA transfer family protein [Terricaulis sp.]